MFNDELSELTVDIDNVYLDPNNPRFGVSRHVEGGRTNEFLKPMCKAK